MTQKPSYNFLIGFFLLTCWAYGQSSDGPRVIDSLITRCKTSNDPYDKKLEDALLAERISKQLNIDSITLKVQRNLAKMYFDNQEYDRYIPLNKSNIELAQKLKDTSALTFASINLGQYYWGIEENDSSYFYFIKALEYFNPKQPSEDEAEILFFLALIQEEEKAYLGAEEEAVKAVRILNQLPSSNNANYLYSSLYNTLAIISNNVGNHEKAIEYYDKTIAYAKKMRYGFLTEVYATNNKANAYRNSGDFNKAIEIYKGLLPLRNKYEEDDPAFYATIIGNIGKTKLMSGQFSFQETENDIRKAYDTAKALGDELLQMDTGLDLAKLYLSETKENRASAGDIDSFSEGENIKLIQSRTDTVAKYTTEALELARTNSVNKIRQDALLKLAEVSGTEDAKELLLEHIHVTDSVAALERTRRNKFARVKFDTEQLEAENEQISRENLYLLVLSIGLLLTAILIYIVISQRAKNRKLKLIQVQQKANEEIYNLMLQQQDKVDEARSLEKKRISEELHDGVLGRLFGTRLSLDSINFKDGKEAMNSRANYIGQLKTIEEDIRKISHELNTDFVSGTRFVDIVSELIENQSQAYGLKSEFNYTDDISWDLVSNKTKINIYRIIQESLQNIYKHAKAKTVKISFSLENDVICLDITDDGQGFDTTKQKKGIGLKNMTSRVKGIDGDIAFTSQVGKGTTVRVKIPYTIQHA
jgi:signal transduction histidine kinase